MINIYIFFYLFTVNVLYFITYEYTYTTIPHNIIVHVYIMYIGSFCPLAFVIASFVTDIWAFFYSTFDNQKQIRRKLKMYISSAVIIIISLHKKCFKSLLIEYFNPKFCLWTITLQLFPPGTITNYVPIYFVLRAKIILLSNLDSLEWLTKHRKK